MSVVVSRQSRLRFKELVALKGFTFWELDNLPTIPLNPSDIYYSPDANERLDLLAFRYYGDPNLWWVIAVANDIDLAPTQFQPGSTIRIPSPVYVASTLFSKDTLQ
jgi:hypothetical protein